MLPYYVFSCSMMFWLARFSNHERLCLIPLTLVFNALYVEYWLASLIALELPTILDKSRCSREGSTDMASCVFGHEAYQISTECLVRIQLKESMHISHTPCLPLNHTCRPVGISVLAQNPIPVYMPVLKGA